VVAAVLAVFVPAVRAITETVLTVGTAGVSGVSVASGDNNYYSFTITSAAVCFVVSLTASSGDPDLFLGNDAGVTTALVSSRSGGSDTITVTGIPSDGYYSTMPQVFHLRVYGFSASTYTLSIVTVPALTMAATVSGSVASKAYQNYFILVDNLQVFTVTGPLLEH